MLATIALYAFSVALALLLAGRAAGSIPARSALLLALLPLILTGPALLTGRVFAPIDLPYGAPPLASLASAPVAGVQNPTLSDIACLNIPWKYATRVAYSRHEAALWNPAIFCGDILAAAAQATPYEPFLLLSFLLPAANSLTFIAAMTLFAAAVCMYLFLRELECGEAPSLLGAAAWMLSTFLVVWLEWVITSSALWLPLVLAGVTRIVRRGSWSGAAILTTAFVMAIVSGHPESVLHVVALGLAWAAYEIAATRGRGIVRAALLGCASGVAALALTAIYLLPIVEAIPQSTEAHFRRDVYTYMSRAIAWRDVPRRLRLQLLPYEAGDPSAREVTKTPVPFDSMENGSAGSVALALAVFALWRSRRRERWALLALAIFGLLIGCGIAPFADWLASLPLFSIALNERLIMATAFGVSALAALGIEALGEGEAVSRRQDFAVVATAAGVALAILVALRWGAMTADGLSARFLLVRSAAAIAVPLLCAVVALLRLRHGMLAAAVLAALLGQRYIEVGRFYPTLPASMFYPHVPVLDRLPRAAEPYRIVGLGYVFIPNISTMYGLEDVRGYEAMTFHRYVETEPLWCKAQPVWFNLVDDLDEPFLSALNVRYALAAPENRVPAGWTRIAAGNGVQILRNDHVLPRAFVPSRVRFEADPAKVLDEMNEEKDFGARGWIEAAGRGDEQPNGPGGVRTLRRGGNELLLDAEMQRDGWVFVSELGWKGWRAYVDGRRVGWEFANHAFVGVPVPRGRHQVRLVYLPQSFVAGRAISAVSLFGVIIGVGAARKRRRRS